MTASELAAVLRARRVRHNEWVAKCPAHPDRHPSLTIKAGDRAVLLCCQSQRCPVESIVRAMGLTMQDLFYESRCNMSPADFRKLEAQRRKEDAQEKAKKRRKDKLIYQARYREGEVYRIGKLLARDFDSVKLAKQFHWSLDRSRGAQAAIRPYFHPANIPGDYL